MFGCAGLGGDDGAVDCSRPSATVASVKVFPPEMSMAPQASFQMATQSFNACGFQVSGVSVDWRFNDRSVAEVNTTGVLNGRGAGRFEVTAVVAGVALAKAHQAPGTPVTSALYVVDLVPTGSGTNPFPPIIVRAEVFPPNPVVAVNTDLQMTVMGYDSLDQPLPSIPFAWRSSDPSVASVSSTGVVRGVRVGQATISSMPAGPANLISPASIPVVVRLENGAPAPTPEVALSARSLVLRPGEVSGNLQVTARSAETGASIPTNAVWRVVSGGGIVTLIASPQDGAVGVRASFTTFGRAVLEAQVNVAGVISTVGPVPVTVAADAPGATPWTTVSPLPDAGGVYNLGLAAVGEYLFTAGGVIGESTGAGGFREDVARARMDLTTGGLTGTWTKSPGSQTRPEDILSSNKSCAGDPPCMEILRTLDEAGNNSDLSRRVHYQVQGHQMVSAANHLYVIGGIDGQVDLCILGIPGTGQGTVAPGCQLETRFSARVLSTDVDVNGGLIPWVEEPTLPLELLGGSTDLGGRLRPATAVYQDTWIYVLGGWNEVLSAATGRRLGRNRAEVYRAKVAPSGALSVWTRLAGRDLPQPLNKHAATIVNTANGDWLVVSGGATGNDIFSPEAVTDQVYRAKLDPATGDFLTPWQVSEALPRPLQYHRMLSVPGDPRVVVVGGDDLDRSLATAFVATLSLVDGEIGPWSRLPDVPTAGRWGGMSSHGGVGIAVPQAVGADIARIYVAGGGSLRVGSNSDLDRRRHVYVLDLP